MGEQFHSNFAKNSKLKIQNIFYVSYLAFSNKEREKENSLQSSKKSHG
jgi:hypothetical protein